MSTSSSSALAYRRMVDCLCKTPELREDSELLELELWFRKKSKLLTELSQEILLDVIKHCEFVTRNEDDIIIQQGEKGHRFYIILRGTVSVYHKDALDDVDLGEETLDSRQGDRSNLGVKLVTFTEGQAFGEIALINPDCTRTASIIAEEKTDLVSIRRDLYNRSVSNVIARELAEKMAFVDSIPLFRGWAPKLKKHLAVSFRKESHNFDSTLVRQGDPALDMYYVVKGEVKLTLNPEAHYKQFERFMQKHDELLDDVKNALQHERAYFPQKLLPQFQKYSRVNKACQMGRRGSLSGPGGVDAGTEELPQCWSPSAIRRLNMELSAKKVELNLCYLGEKQTIGDLEFLIGLDSYHVTASCSQETTVMVLHKPHFDRLVRRRSPTTLREMSSQAELKLTQRVLKPHVLEVAPLMRCLLYKLRTVTGENRQGDEKKFLAEIRDLAHAQGGISTRSQPSRSRAISSSSPRPQTGKRSLAT